MLRAAPYTLPITPHYYELPVTACPFTESFISETLVCYTIPKIPEHVAELIIRLFCIIELLKQIVELEELPIIIPELTPEIFNNTYKFIYINVMFAVVASPPKLLAKPEIVIVELLTTIEVDN